MATRVVIYPAAIQSHFAPGGDVAKNARSVGRTGQALARLQAPKRTGRLAGSVNWNGIMGALTYIVTVYAYTPYAMYVLLGTTSPITPWNGRFLSVPAFRGAPYRVLRQYVRGQRANNFLERGVEQSLGFHGYPPVVVDTVASVAN